MKHLFLAVLIALSYSGVSITFEDTQRVEAACVELKESGLDNEQLARRGCCSWHGGVCGCEGGRTVCCDNTFSPSCTCHADDVPDEIIN